MRSGPENTMSNSKKDDFLLCLLRGPEPKEIIQRIEKEHPGLEVKYISVPRVDRSQKNVGGIPEELYARATVLFTLDFLPPTPSAAPNLSLIQFSSAGTNHIVNHPIYTDSKIPLTTASGVHGPQIAEWVIMTTLVQSQSYNSLYEAQKRKEWIHNSYAVKRDMVGQRVGVLGYGSIGRQGE